MLLRLIILFTTVPLLELTLLLKLNTKIGFMPTISIVLITGVVGAYLAKSQGRDIIMKIRFDISQGRMPANELINGLCVLVGGAMLLTPGIITDGLGFILVIPMTREIIKIALKKRIENMIDDGRINFY
ncbi:FxsA family protein [Anaeromicrobium sediminis]|uniref:FxsA protein n=1 Tax=Anaeromicrobium sediminis TaxID=1478221 RepID=A0A267MEZ3_9FIRM|nr:FxsA family protein [Anaeromicrobium sediminis]PAB58151.1 FxsA protein [Anaeromicrobium sediminis]